MPLPGAAFVAYKKANTIRKVASTIKNTADNNSSTIMGVFIISMCVIFIILGFIYVLSYDVEDTENNVHQGEKDMSEVADVSDTSSQRNQNEGYRHRVRRRNLLLQLLLGFN